jgi:hypothetical protein
MTSGEKIWGNLNRLQNQKNQLEDAINVLRCAGLDVPSWAYPYELLWKEHEKITKKISQALDKASQ